MNKKLLLAAGLALMSAAASAQEVKFYNTGRKWNSSFDALLNGNSIHRVTRKGAETVSPETNLQLQVTTTWAVLRLWQILPLPKAIRLKHQPTSWQ